MTTPRTRTPRRNPWRQTLRDDRGSATGWALGMMIVATLLIALVVDGARAMTAKVEATDLAQQAARAGADQIDLTTLRTTGQVRLDPQAAQQAAQQWLTATATTGTATATATTVTVTVTRTDPTLLMNILGVDTITITATAHAEPTTD